ncbi:MAG: hypothetical protein HYV09_21325 [Deltaproteobacteria bacterium]|nr:hypothetical protein [Deltaproteobacteria bacterium]
MSVVASVVASVVVSVALLASACSSTVQDLGRAPDEPVTEPAAAPAVAEGLGGGWNDSVLGRDIACPLTRPIEGDPCPPRNTAPCTYHGAPPPPPDYTPVTAPEKTTTFCMCTSNLLWRCLQGITIRTLEQPVREGDPCVDSLVIERRCLEGECVGTISCRCAGGRARCTR